MINRCLGAFVVLISISVTCAQAEAPPKYRLFCIGCHATGAANAPKTGDTAAWNKRLVVGLDALVESAKKGKKQMPPKGLCSDCSDAELRAIIQYMAQ